jgi:hypothetical protein
VPSERSKRGDLGTANRNKINFNNIKTEFLSLKDILFLSTLKYPTNSNYTNYNPKSISGEINIDNRDNDITDSDKLKLD